MSLNNYISELKRRHVFKSAIAYLIVAWLIVQVASIVLPTFEAPPWVMKSLLFILSIGFPVNIIVAWIYDITPEGIKKTKNIDLKSQKSVIKNSRLNKVIIISLSIAVIVLLYNQFGLSGESEISDQAMTTEKPIASNLIAVLPFLNTKADVKTDYLGFAIADQIIGSLVYLNHITVRPSSSVRKFENQTIDPTVVGKDLNVDYILVGNYLKENDIIRLNIELINLKTNKIVWREPVEVNYKSAFQLQDIVSKKVVNGLDIQFSQQELNRINKDIPTNPLAYEYYLRAVAYPRDNVGDELAIEMLKKSIALDSLYAPSYALLGDRLHTLANYGLLDTKESRKAENYLKKGLGMNPDLFNAMSGLAFIYTETGRIEEAVKLTRKMIEISPNNADAHFNLSYIYRYVGMNDEAVIETDKALALDSKNPRFRSSLITYMFAGKNDKALNAVDNFQKTAFTTVHHALIYVHMGKPQKAIPYLKKAHELEREGLTGQLALAILEGIDGNKDEVKRIMKNLEAYNLIDAEPWYFFSECYGMINDSEGTARCLKRAVEGGFYNYPLMMRDVFLDPVRENPAIKEILEIAKQKHLAFQKGLF